MTRSLLVGLLVASTAVAQVYTWTDKNGVTHFTDNPGSVPANVKAKVTEGSDISTVTLPKDEERPAKPASQAKTAVAEPDPNRAEREWRAAFREANERIARLQDEIEVDRKKVEDLNGLPAGGRYQCLYGGGWMVPGGGVVGTGSSVTLTGQGGLGLGVNGSVVVTQTQVVVPNSPIATAPCVYTLNPEFERAKERLELNRKALVRAKADFSELERRASFEGVPREWRR